MSQILKLGYEMRPRVWSA